MSSDFFRVTLQRQLQFSECEASDAWVSASPAHLCCEHKLWLLTSLVLPGWAILAEGTGPHSARRDHDLGGRRWNRGVDAAVCRLGRSLEMMAARADGRVVWINGDFLPR